MSKITQKNSIMKIYFAEKLKELRLEQGFTQEYLADVFHVSRVTITHWEKGVQEPKLEVVADIAKFFNVSVGYLLGIED